MCRRFSLAADLPEVTQYFQISKVMFPYRHRFNISPTQTVPVVLQSGGERILDEYRWGLVPFWGKDSLNADLYSVHENSAYWRVVERQRCIIPCSGFYYWRQAGKKSYPMRAILRTRGIFGVAGLYDIWKDSRGEQYRTCTLLMTRANELIAEFDARMPAILEQSEAEAWLNSETTEVEALARMLRPYNPARMNVYPVSPLVNNDLNDTSDCIKEMDLKVAWVKN